MALTYIIITNLLQHFVNTENIYFAPKHCYTVHISFHADSINFFTGMLNTEELELAPLLNLSSNSIIKHELRKIQQAVTDKSKEVRILFVFLTFRKSPETDSSGVYKDKRSLGGY